MFNKPMKGCPYINLGKQLAQFLCTPLSHSPSHITKMKIGSLGPSILLFKSWELKDFMYQSKLATSLLNFIS